MKNIHVVIYKVWWNDKMKDQLTNLPVVRLVSKFVGTDQIGLARSKTAMLHFSAKIIDPTKKASKQQVNNFLMADSLQRTSLLQPYWYLVQITEIIPFHGNFGNLDNDKRDRTIWFSRVAPRHELTVLEREQFFSTLSDGAERGWFSKASCFYPIGSWRRMNLESRWMRLRQEESQSLQAMRAGIYAEKEHVMH
jgi:hypothetical protein